MAQKPTREGRRGINEKNPAVTPPIKAVGRPVVSRVAPPAGTGPQNRQGQGAITNRPISERAVDDSTPRSPGRVIPRPAQQEPAIRDGGETPKFGSPGAVSHARP